MKSKHTTAKFIIDCKHVTVNGVPELEGITGGLVGEEVASFLKDGHEWYLANIKTGRYRKLTSHCRVTVDDGDIDYEAIMRKCPNGLYNAETKSIRYSSVSLYDGKFKNGISAISWMLYPDGQYFADSDGFGMEDNYEEVVYAIIDTNLEIIEPFRPIPNIKEYLRVYNQEEINEILDAPSFDEFHYLDLPESKPRVYNFILLDESASMENISSVALSKVNEIIHKIQDQQTTNPDKEYYITLIKFNTIETWLYESTPVRDIIDLSLENYCPTGGTALFAIADEWLDKCLDEGWKTFSRCARVYNLTIITDGHDTSSGDLEQYSHLNQTDIMNSCHPNIKIIIIPNDNFEEEISTVDIELNPWELGKILGVDLD